MHFVDCGAEPPSLDKLRNPQMDWDKAATGPDYRRFMKDFSKKSDYLCGYCEQFCQGKGDPLAENRNTVDHFRPKGNPRYRHLTFEWANLVYSCSRCNQAKGNQFPGLTDDPWFVLNLTDKKLGASVESLASRVYAHPSMTEGYFNPRNHEDWVAGEDPPFAFDERGFILPNGNLDNDPKWSRALRTIVDLNLNPIPDENNPIGEENILEQRHFVAESVRALEASERRELAETIGEGNGVEFPTLVKWVLNHPD